MANTFYCPACGQAVTVDAAAGIQVQCGLCEAVVTVPQPVTQPDGGTPPTAPSDPVVVGLVRAGLATGALVCGIVGLVPFCFPVGLVGLILGIVAVVKASRQPDEYGGTGRAVGGICTGAVGFLVWPVILTMMLSVMLPSFVRARELAMRSVCAANLQGIGNAMQIYANTNQDAFPPDFNTLIASGSVSPGQFICPSSEDDAGSRNGAYVVNLAGGVPEEELRTCYEYIEGQKTNADSRNVLVYEKANSHDEEGGNVLFVDGHTEFVTPYSDIEELVDETLERLKQER